MSASGTLVLLLTTGQLNIESRKVNHTPGRARLNPTRNSKQNEKIQGGGRHRKSRGHEGLPAEALQPCTLEG
jgi:hypothetical protein